MKKSIFTILAVTFLITACADKSETPEAPVVTDTPEVTTYTPEIPPTPPTEPFGFSWLVEPTLEYEQIAICPFLSYNGNRGNVFFDVETELILDNETGLPIDTGTGFIWYNDLAILPIEYKHNCHCEGREDESRRIEAIEVAAAVNSNNRHGVKDKNGEVIVSFTFDEILLIWNGLAFAKSDGKYGIIKFGDYEPPPEAPPVKWFEGVLVDLFEHGLTDEQLAEMVENGEIPADVTHLKLGKNLITDISPLSKLVSLEWIWLDNVLGDGMLQYHNRVNDFTPLNTLPNLKALSLWGNGISDLSSLSRLTSLEVLDFGGAWYGNPISDARPLSGLTNLRWLSLYNSNLNDISPLSGLTKLEHLSLGNNNITDVSPLAELTGLTYLFLGGNYYLSDISSLSGLINLEYLHIGITDVSDEQKKALQSALSDCDISQEGFGGW
jgi:hypothetical protein